MGFCIGFEGLRVAYLAERFELLLIKDTKMKGWRIEAAPKRSEGIAYSRNKCLSMVYVHSPKAFV
jgi:hypothetical protein